MSDKKIIAVVGATGAQGGGLARAILADKNSAFAVRALTRNVDSDKAKELAALGAEVVAADVDDGESLKRAPLDLSEEDFADDSFFGGGSDDEEDDFE